MAQNAGVVRACEIECSSRYWAKSCASSVDRQECINKIKTQTAKTTVSEKPIATRVVEWVGEGTVTGHVEGDEIVSLA